MKRLIILFLLFAVNASAQEGLPEFSQNTVSVLNDHLRNVDRRLRGAVSKDLLNVTGVLPLGNGGTGEALIDPGDDRILFWDDGAGEVAWLTLGTDLTILGTTVSV